MTRWLSTCGNGIVEGLEECDDGDTIGGNGCNARCRVEPGWSCKGNPSVCSRRRDPAAAPASAGGGGGSQSGGGDGHPVHPDPSDQLKPSPGDGKAAAEAAGSDKGGSVPGASSGAPSGWIIGAIAMASVVAAALVIVGLILVTFPKASEESGVLCLIVMYER